MATTPNYGWTTPDNTSFVKDGAQAIRNLGDSIDSSVAGLKSANSSFVGETVANPAGIVFAASAGTDPSVSIVTGTRALVVIDAQINCAGNFNFVGFAVSGATTIAANDADAVMLGGISASTKTTSHTLVTLTAGTNVFTMRYRCNASASGTIGLRRLTVIPLP